MQFLRDTIRQCPYVITSSVHVGIQLETYYLIPSKFDDEVVALKSYTITTALRHPLKWAFVWPRRFARRKLTYTIYSVTPAPDSDRDPGGRTRYTLSTINSFGRRVGGEIVIWSTPPHGSSTVPRMFMAVITRNTVVVYSNAKNGVELDDRAHIETLVLQGPGTNINVDLQL